MAKASPQTRRSSQEKYQPPEPKVTVPDEKPSTLENVISVVLGLAVVLVIGAMIVNTIRNRQKEQTNPPTAATTQEATPSPVAKGTYTVKAGDTLWSIAVAEYNDGFKWPEIEKANNMNASSHLEPGMKLVIPPLPSGTQVAEAVTPAPTAEMGTGSTGPTGGSTGPTGGLEQQGQTLSTSTDREYTVVKGDCLWTIAVKHYGNGYRWVDIAKANHLANPNLIHPGNVFQLPV